MHISNFCLRLYVLSARQVIKKKKKKRAGLKTLPKQLGNNSTNNPTFVGPPLAAHGAAPRTATRKPRASSKYALQRDALPCLSLQKLFQGSPESSHTGLLRDTELIRLVYTSKTCSQNDLIPVIST